MADKSDRHHAAASRFFLSEAAPDQDFSFTDCTSFALMERLGVAEAFAFDRHFLVYRYGANRQRALRRWPRSSAKAGEGPRQRRFRPDSPDPVRADHSACQGKQ